MVSHLQQTNDIQLHPSLAGKTYEQSFQAFFEGRIRYKICIDVINFCLDLRLVLKVTLLKPSGEMRSSSDRGLVLLNVLMHIFIHFSSKTCQARCL